MKTTSTAIASVLLALTGCGDQKSVSMSSQQPKNDTAKRSANFLNVKSKFCDQKETTVKNGERIFIDLDQGIIGIGFTTDQNCKVVDFKSATVTEFDDKQTKLAVVTSVGRKSSCQDGVLPYAGLEFKNAIFTADTLAIENIDHKAGECSEIVFKFSPATNANKLPINKETTDEKINHCPELKGTYSCHSPYGAFDGVYSFSYSDDSTTKQSTYQITPEGKQPVTYVVGDQSSYTGICKNDELRIFNHDADDSAFGFEKATTNGIDIQINYYVRTGANIVSTCKKQNP